MKGTPKDEATRSYQYIMKPMPIPLPLQKPLQTRVTDVSCGRAHALVLADNEGVFSMGNNAFGQCGRKIVDGELYSENRKIQKKRHGM